MKTIKDGQIFNNIFQNIIQVKVIVDKKTEEFEYLVCLMLHLQIFFLAIFCLGKISENVIELCPQLELII